MDSHIDNNSSLFNILPCDHSGFSHRSDQNIRPLRHFFQIFCPGMRHGDGSVLPKQQKSHRLADDIASSDNHTFLSRDFDAGTFQKLYNAGRRTGNKSLLSDAERSHALGMETVHILFRSDRTNHRIFADMFRHRKLYQNTVHVFPFVQLTDQRKQFLLRRFLRQLIGKRCNADISAGFLFIAHIDAGCRVVSYLNDSKADGNTRLLHLRDLFFQFFFYLCRNFFSVYNLWHMNPPFV